MTVFFTTNGSSLKLWCSELIGPVLRRRDNVPAGDARHYTAKSSTEPTRQPQFREQDIELGGIPTNS